MKNFNFDYQSISARYMRIMIEDTIEIALDYGTDRYQIGLAEYEELNKHNPNMLSQHYKTRLMSL